MEEDRWIQRLITWREGLHASVGKGGLAAHQPRPPGRLLIAHSQAANRVAQICDGPPHLWCHPADHGRAQSGEASGECRMGHFRRGPHRRRFDLLDPMTTPGAGHRARGSEDARGEAP